MSTDQTTQKPGVTLRDSGRGEDSIVGGPHIDTLISYLGDDTMKGNDGADIYVINNTNYHREVNIIDTGENWLAIDDGTSMMKLEIQKNAVLLDGEPLKKAETSPNGQSTFIHKIDNLTLLITPDDKVNNKVNNQHTSTADTTNPIMQKLAELPPESKLAVLDHIHQQMQQQILLAENDLNH